MQKSAKGIREFQSRACSRSAGSTHEGVAYLPNVGAGQDKHAADPHGGGGQGTEALGQRVRAHAETE